LFPKDIPDICAFFPVRAAARKQTFNSNRSNSSRIDHALGEAQRMRAHKRHQRRSSPRGAVPRLGSLSFFAYAVEYLDAALAIRAKDSSFKPAQSYLACHAIELALSAYLTLHGRSVDRLGRNRGTLDLRSLLEDADACGLDKLARLTQVQRKQIKKANRYYAEMVFQYPALTESIRGYPEAADVRTLLAAATLLVKSIQAACGELLERALGRALKRR
jgi:hypothetical protein